MMGLEGKIAGIIVSMAQSGRKRERSPSPDPPLAVEEGWVDIEEKDIWVELQEGQVVVI